MMLVIQFDGQRHDRCAFGLQGPLEKRVACVVQQQAGRRSQTAFAAELYCYAIVVPGEMRLGELQFEFGQNADCGLQCICLLTDAGRHLQPDAMNLGLLFVRQANQLVVLLDGFQWLDEHRLAAG